MLWTLLDSKALKENVFFILLELGVNLIVAIDIIFKIKLAGFKRYFTTCSNIFDFCVASGCILLFITILIMSASNSKFLIFEEIGEEILFIIWSAWQYLRIIMLIKNQRKAKDDAADLIRFSEVEDLERQYGSNSLKLQLEENQYK